MDTPKPSHADVPVPPPLLFLVVWGLGFGLNLIAPLTMRAATSRTWAAWALLLIGSLLVAWALVTLWRAKTAILPHDETKHFVTHGLYRRTRNPIYLGLALLYLSAALFAGIMWPILLLPLLVRVVDRWVIQREEAYLVGLFPDVYEPYSERTARWVLR
jgi:protein-S-isoprenylcysteine O-methyltransferase Ste14